jgi:mono/diheme cytochrome c family protein
VQTRTLVLIILLPVTILVLAGVVYLVFSARQKAQASGIPPSRRPGPTDEALEGPVLERYQAWGLILTAFLALLLPALYLREPDRQAEAAEKELETSREQGAHTYQEFCARCHGPDAKGGVVKRFKQPGNPDAEPADYPAPNLTEISTRHPDQRVAQVAWDTIQKGREGTPMPAWGVRSNGPMNDQQITDLVNWLISIQADGKPRDPLKFEAKGGAQ